LDGTAPNGTKAAPIGEDRRVLKLESVALAAKAFVPATEREIDCVVTELSADGASLTTPEASSIGSEIALYIEGFDRFSACVVRSSSDRLDVKFNCSPNKRARTAEKIEHYRSGRAVAPTSLRSAQRSPFNSVRDFKRQNGEIVTFEVIDISLSGASLRTKCRPAIDEIITIGTLAGRVARHFDDGIAVEFARRAPPEFGAIR
jgi:hypothetical protein